MSKAIKVLTSVPNIAGRAPKFSVTAFQLVLVKKERPNLRMAGTASMPRTTMVPNQNGDDCERENQGQFGESLVPDARPITQTED